LIAQPSFARPSRTPASASAACQAGIPSAISHRQTSAPRISWGCSFYEARKRTLIAVAENTAAIRRMRIFSPGSQPVGAFCFPTNRRWHGLCSGTAPSGASSNHLYWFALAPSGWSLAAGRKFERQELRVHSRSGIPADPTRKILTEAVLTTYSEFPFMFTFRSATG
jgi:hypothetical protein